jgi:hypothetical protein
VTNPTTYTDRKGRTLADRVAEIQRGGNPITPEQRTAAEQLLAAMLAAAEQHGVSLDDFDWTIDLPGGCLDVILSKTSRY